MTAKRYAFIDYGEAKRRGLPGADQEVPPNSLWALFERNGEGQPIRMVATDGGHREDLRFPSGLKWVVDELNALDARLQKQESVVRQAERQVDQTEQWARENQAAAAELRGRLELHGIRVPDDTGQQTLEYLETLEDLLTALLDDDVEAPANIEALAKKAERLKRVREEG